ncbi:MAG TPA: hypothetical protein VIL15_06135 [Coriobacteriia bacterium]
MANGIGAAGDFYRVRTMHFDTIDSTDFEWREDILYRRPETADPAEGELYKVEAVALDDDENVTVLGVFEGADDAHEANNAATADLTALTRSEFEERYFPAGS